MSTSVMDLMRSVETSARSNCADGSLDDFKAGYWHGMLNAYGMAACTPEAFALKDEIAARIWQMRVPEPHRH